jgi:hypothetical protein
MSSEMGRFESWWRTFSEANPLASPQQAAAAAWEAAPSTRAGRFTFRLRFPGFGPDAGQLKALGGTAGPDGSVAEFTRDGDTLAVAVNEVVKQARGYGLDPILEVGP